MGRAIGAAVLYRFSTHPPEHRHRAAHNYYTAAASSSPVDVHIFFLLPLRTPFRPPLGILCSSNLRFHCPTCTTYTTTRARSRDRIPHIFLYVNALFGRLRRRRTDTVLPGTTDAAVIVHTGRFFYRGHLIFSMWIFKVLLFVVFVNSIYIYFYYFLSLLFRRFYTFLNIFSG